MMMQDKRMNIANFFIFIVNIMIFMYLLRIDYNTKKLEDMKNSIEALVEVVNKLDRHELVANRSETKYDLSYLQQQTPYVVGPLQDDEAVYLYGLVKALRPKTIIEFGFFKGDSSRNFLKALGDDGDARMYSFDITQRNPDAESLKDSRFKFHLKSQTEFSPLDIDNRLIDIAFMDAGHTMDIQKPAFEKIIKQTSPTAIIIVHDTGLHAFEKVKSHKCVCDFSNLCGGVHRKEERLFINWISINYPEWQIINIHSFETYRHGLTILQRKYNLSMDEVDKSNCKYV